METIVYSILLIVGLIGFAIFSGNAIVALIYVKKQKIDGFWKNSTILISFVITFILVLVSLISFLNVIFKIH